MEDVLKASYDDAARCRDAARLRKKGVAVNDPQGWLRVSARKGERKGDRKIVVSVFEKREGVENKGRKT